MPAGMLYRWEDQNHGLEHKCGTCSTVLSSPRAKKTCFGVHEEVCTRYHKTLFFVGQSHHCDACHKSIELHDKRHREIVEIVQAIQRLNGGNSPTFNRKRKGRKEDIFDLPDLTTEIPEIDDRHDSLDVEWDNNSSTLNDEEPEQRSQQWNADANRAAKLERKMAKNQVRFSVITKEDLDKIQNALHPEVQNAEKSDEALTGQGLVDNSTIDQNIGFNSNCFKYGSLRKSDHDKKISKDNASTKHVDIESSEHVDNIMLSLMKSLGTQVKAPRTNSKERKRLETKLRGAIANDLIAFENELKETMERMAGYWRYVNRRTYNQMVENNELWDWATGQKLLEVAEDNDLDVIVEEDEGTETETLDGSTTATTPLDSPENWNEDKKLELTINSLSSSDPDNSSTGEDGRKTPTRAGFASHFCDVEDLTESNIRHFPGMHIEPLFYSPGRSPGPTYSFRVPSPSLSDDNDNEDWKYLHNFYEDDFFVFPRTKGKPRVAVLPMTPDRKRKPPIAFQGTKDDRPLGAAVKVHSASPPPQNKPGPKPRAWRKTPLFDPVQPDVTGDMTNQFAGLQREVPAPRDEPKKPDPKTRAKVMSLALPARKAALQAEDGWQVKGSPSAKKNKKNLPPFNGNKAAPLAVKRVVFPKQSQKGIVSPAKPQATVEAGSTWANVVAAAPTKTRR